MEQPTKQDLETKLPEQTPEQTSTETKPENAVPEKTPLEQATAKTPKKRGRKPKYQTEEERRKVYYQRTKDWRENNKSYLSVCKHYRENISRTLHRLFSYIDAIQLWNLRNKDRQFDLSEVFNALESYCD
jgi:hypothetical protein